MYRLVRIQNVTRGTEVAPLGRVAQSIRERVLGLHLLPRLDEGEGLLLPNATTIDTTFMRYPIDLVFVDRDLRVTRVVPDLVPWRMVVRTHGGASCLELPAGTAQRTTTQPGDQLQLSER